MNRPGHGALVSRAWRLGAGGEEKVASQLARLPVPWQVVRSVAVGSTRCHIDHLLIGPAGVYAISTKHHPAATIDVKDDVVKVDGQPRPHVYKARWEAARAGRMLSEATGCTVDVIGVLAVVAMRGGFRVTSQPSDGTVVVLGRRELTPWLTRQRQILDPEQVGTLLDAARRPTTWREATPALARR